MISFDKHIVAPIQIENINTFLTGGGGRIQKKVGGGIN